MKLTGKITDRELADVLMGLPVDMEFSSNLENKFEHGLAVLLKESSQKVTLMKIYPYDKGSSSVLNEFREKLGFEIKDNFEFKMYANKTKSPENTVNEASVMRKLFSVQEALSKLKSPDSYNVRLSDIAADYVAGGSVMLHKYLANSNDASQLSTKLDAFIISLKAQCDQGVTLEPKRGITKSDIQCVIVEDSMYDEICERMPGTGIHAVQRSTFERSVIEQARAKDFQLVS